MDPTLACVLPDCTIGKTGKCLKSYNPPEACPNLKVPSPISPEIASSDMPAADEVRRPARLFPSGNEMGTYEANNLMRCRYVHLIGILGPTNVGKTSLLASLYLLLVNESAPQYLFAGSETLIGFENRAKGLRQWKKGGLPDQLVEHTILQDDRNPSLMHICLAIAGDAGKKKIDVLLTDLPGEWTDSLIDRADTAHRFDFLKRADGIIIAIDGPLLADPKTRHVEIQKNEALLGRLRNSVRVELDIPMVLMLTKGDEINMISPPGLKNVEKAAIDMGFSPVTILSIAFSRRPDKFGSGVGILDAIETITNKDWPLIARGAERRVLSNRRSFSLFRHLEKV